MSRIRCVQHGMGMVNLEKRPSRIARAVLLVAMKVRHICRSTSWLRQGVMTCAISLAILAFLSIPVSADIAKALEVCASDPDPDARKACYAAVQGAQQPKSSSLETLLETFSGLATKGRKKRPPYEIVQTEDAIDGSPFVELAVRARNNEYDAFHIRCSRNVTSAFVSSNDYPWLVNRVDVQYRVGSADHASTVWQDIPNVNAFGFSKGVQAIPFVRSMAGSSSIFVRIEPNSESELNFEFDLIQANNDVGKVANACNWKLAGSKEVPQAEDTTNQTSDLSTTEQILQAIQGDLTDASQSESTVSQASDLSFDEQLTQALKVQSTEIANTSKPISISVHEAVAAQLRKCWVVPAGAKNAENMVIAIRVDMNPDATVRNALIVDIEIAMADSYFRAAAQSALRAVKNPRCQPLPLPLDQYDQWRTLTLNFNPQDML
jgi:hypothetical protein